MTETTEATEALIRCLGEDQVATDRERCYAASMDNLRYSRMPAARVFPADEEAVGKVLELAGKWSVPVTARGAGSATTGAASPSEGGWVLDFSEWKNLHIDPVARMAFVQPGVNLSELDAASSRFGLFYPPDPGSKAYATVGGTIATNAGGMRGAKYGVTRDYVLSLEGFLASGRFVRWAANLRKFSSGYNIRDLWVGSEGTLGIITGAVLRLIPRPLVHATCLAIFPGEEEALRCGQKIMLSGVTPSALEFLDRQTVACTFAFWKRKDPQTLQLLPECLRQSRGGTRQPAVLIIEVDGDKQVAEQDMETVLKIIKRHTNEWTRSTDPVRTELLWKIRRSCSQAMFELGPRKLNEDVVIPYTHHVDLIRHLREIHARTGLATPTFGHAADGNFHAHIMFDDTDPGQREQAREAVDSLMRKVIELGGAISGEHGIGLAKSPFFSLQHSEAEIEVMRSLKQAFDPNNILNPGKLWTPSEPWQFPREAVSLPWDH